MIAIEPMVQNIVMRSMMTSKILNSLDIFDKVGIVSADRFNDVKPENHPKKYMEDFKSIIVFAEGKGSSDASDMGGFSDYLGTISSQTEVMGSLKKFGYDSIVVDGAHNDLSLVRMGIEAGLGEISPVNSLVVKGYGLTTTLGAIITNAPLIADEKVTDVCTHCNKCLNVCPIREIANAKGDLNKCACGKCVPICPV